MNDKKSGKRAVFYWAATILLEMELIIGGVLNLMRADYAVATVTQLGYPIYILSILGAWKILGGIAILAPRLPRLKEWAYAGVFFNLSGAIVSHLWSGDAPTTIIAPLVFLVIALVSWRLRPESRRSLAAPDIAPSSAAASIGWS